MYKKVKIPIGLLALFYINLFIVDISYAGLFCDSVDIAQKNVSWCLPPYGRGINKNGVDPRTGCLKKLEFPGDFRIYMFDICVENPMEEDVKENNDGTTKNPIFARKYVSYSFDPEIIVRTQRVSWGSAYFDSEERLKHGDCTIFANPGLGIPTTRICARKAGPIDSDKNGNSKFDHGYTIGKYVDNNGNEKDDPKIQLDELDEKGKKLELEVSYLKLCAYDDPGILQNLEMFFLGGLIGGLITLDLMDYNPVYQPNHLGAEPPGFIMDLYNLLSSPSALASALVKLIDTIPIIGKLGIGNFIGSLIDKVIEGEKEVIKVLFSSNKVVNEVLTNQYADKYDKYETRKSYGCINIPIGPYPPKYCGKLTIIPPSPETHKICSMDQYGIVAQSGFVNSIDEDGTRQEKCVLSTKYDNNFISNTIRVGVSKIIPICKDDDNDDCAIICQRSNDGTEDCSINNPENTKKIHQQKDIIYRCSEGSSDQNCIKIKGEKANSFAQNLIAKQKPFRPVYAVQYQSDINIGKDDNKDQESTTTLLLKQSDFYDETNSKDIVLYGINVGDYEDVNLKFGASQDKDLQFEQGKDTITSKYLYKEVNVSYKNQTHNLFVQLGSRDSYNQGNFELCAYQKYGTSNYQKIGCEKRAPTISPVASYKNPEVEYKKEEDEYTDDKKKELKKEREDFYFKPQMRITLEIPSLKDKYSVSYDIDANVFSDNPKNNSSDDNVNIFVNKYSKSIIDKDYQTQNNSTNNCKLYEIDSKNPKNNPYARSHYCGNYFNNIDSIDKNGELVKNNFYIGGFEKIGGKYRRGGGWFCIDDNNSKDSCDLNSRNFSKCILAKIDNSISDKIELTEGQKKIYKNASNKIDDRILPEPNATYDELKIGFDVAKLFVGCGLSGNTAYCSNSVLTNNKQELSRIDGNYKVSRYIDGKYKDFNFAYKCVGYNYEVTENNQKNTARCYIFDFQDNGALRNKNSSESGLCLKIDENWSPKCIGGIYENDKKQEIILDDGEYNLGLILKEKVKCKKHFDGKILKVDNYVDFLNFEGVDSTINIIKNNFGIILSSKLGDKPIEDIYNDVYSCVRNKLSSEFSNDDSSKNIDAYCTLDDKNNPIVKFEDGCKKPPKLEYVKSKVIVPCTDKYKSNK